MWFIQSEGKNITFCPRVKILPISLRLVGRRRPHFHGSRMWVWWWWWLCTSTNGSIGFLLVPSQKPRSVKWFESLKRSFIWLGFILLPSRVLSPECWTSYGLWWIVIAVVEAWYANLCTSMIDGHLEQDPHRVSILCYNQQGPLIAPSFSTEASDLLILHRSRGDKNKRCLGTHGAHLPFQTKEHKAYDGTSTCQSMWYEQDTLTVTTLTPSPSPSTDCQWPQKLPVSFL